IQFWIRPRQTKRFRHELLAAASVETSQCRRCCYNHQPVTSNKVISKKAAQIERPFFVIDNNTAVLASRLRIGLRGKNFENPETQPSNSIKVNEDVSTRRGSL